MCIKEIRQHYAEAADKPKVLAMGNSPVEEVLRTYGYNNINFGEAPVVTKAFNCKDLSKK